MNIKLNQKTIIELCGPVSFKRGDAFFRAHKVTLDEYNSIRCEATVAGAEDFHVIVEKNANGGFLTACSCPKLASFQKECQHIAAVLLSISERQRQEKTVLVPGTPVVSSPDLMLAEGLLNIFNDRHVKASGHQLHFEKRKVVETSFTCKPVTTVTGQMMFGIEITIDSVKVQHLRRFLEHVKRGKPSP
ncbi:MAG: helicase SNF, partial [Bacillota bacterium]|nr:helicase SNF [Bacillota bacterium]